MKPEPVGAPALLPGEGESDLARIGRIGDSVFAVTLTLLAYRVRIPHDDVLASGSLVPLIPFLEDLGAVAASFLVASLLWISHWRVFRRLRRSDLSFVTLNLLFLGALVLLPITTSLISGRPTRTGTLAYSANLLYAALASLLLRLHARRIDPTAFDGRRVLLAPGLLAAIFALAVAVSAVRPSAAKLVWALALVVPSIERRWGMGRSG